MNSLQKPCQSYQFRTRKDVHPTKKCTEYFHGLLCSLVRQTSCKVLFNWERMAAGSWRIGGVL